MSLPAWLERTKKAEIPAGLPSGHVEMALEHGTFTIDTFSSLIYHDLPIEIHDFQLALFVYRRVGHHEICGPCGPPRTAAQVLSGKLPRRLREVRRCAQAMSESMVFASMRSR